MITVSDEADISAEETVNSSNSGLFQDSISVGSATTETDTTPPNFVVFLGMTVTSEQLPAVAVNSFDREEKNPHKTTSVTFTIPSDKVSLTNERKTAGWYIPQGGLKLTAEDVRVYQPKVLAEKASVADTTVTVPLQVLFLNEGKTLNVALVPTSTTSYDGRDNNAISGTDMRNTESKEQHYYFALSGSQKYEYRIPIRCYTATFDNVTAGTYAVWVQVDDTDTWVKVGDSITVGNTAGGDSDTVIMTDKDLDDIRNGYDDDDEYDDEYDTADVYSGKGYNDREDGDDEYDDYTSGRDSDEVNPHMHKIMKILTVVVIAIIALILVFTVGKAAGVFKSFGGITTEDEADASGKVTVPDIRGLTEEQAKSVLNKKHLGIKIVKRTESKKYKAGLISKQTPEAGEKVKKNTTIEVVVSSGQVKSKKQVPDVRGMGETEAQKELEDAGFKVTSSFQYDDSVASGNVISTTPSAGTKAEKGSTVTMLVSQGTDKKTVPDVRGMADATAQSTIKNYGFNVGTVTYDYSDSVEKGMVISQTVTPGGKAAAGTTISITVSNGPKPEEKIDIQSFVGQQESALKSWASQNGLYTNVSDSQYSSSYAKGCIISMSPSSGNISKGGTISYVVSLGAKPQETTNGGTTGDNNNQNGSNTNDGTTTGQ